MTILSSLAWSTRTSPNNTQSVMPQFLLGLWIVIRNIFKDSWLAPANLHKSYWHVSSLLTRYLGNFQNVTHPLISPQLACWTVQFLKGASKREGVTLTIYVVTSIHLSHIQDITIIRNVRALPRSTTVIRNGSKDRWLTYKSPQVFHACFVLTHMLSRKNSHEVNLPY